MDEQIQIDAPPPEPTGWTDAEIEAGRRRIATEIAAEQRELRAHQEAKRDVPRARRRERE